MFRIDNATAAASADAVPEAGTEKHFTEGNPSTSVPATDVPAWWLNMIQDEIRAVVVAAGLTPDKDNNAQLLAAINLLKGIGQPYDIPFYAGFDSDGTGKDLAVQAYGRIVLPRDITIIADMGHLVTAATGADLIVDVELNGSTIYTTKPQFDAASTTFEAGVIDGADDEVEIDADAGDVLEFKVTQIGSTIAGQRLTFSLKAVTR
ncbi:MAG: hypothetical protein RH946_00830 [Rhodospirillales bacterium]